MQLWDLLKGLEVIEPTLADIQAGDSPNELTMTIEATGDMAGLAVYATLFAPQIEALELTDLPTSHHQGPIFLNVLKSLDMPQALAMSAEHTSIILKGEGSTSAAWDFAIKTSETLGWNSITRAE